MICLWVNGAEIRRRGVSMDTSLILPCAMTPSHNAVLHMSERDAHTHHSSTLILKSVDRILSITIYQLIT